MTSVVACIEPWHDDLRDVREHDRDWVECVTCGRQWAIHGEHAERVTEGDGWCDEKT